MLQKIARTALAATMLAASPALALIHGTDSSSLVSVSTFQKALSEGFVKAIPRGYSEACSQGGSVDSNFVATYNNARSAGITDIDTYWFPCTGSGNPCKSFDTQIAELGSTFQNNGMSIGTIWVDIEESSVCGAWDYGTSGNLNKAQELVSAMQASGYVFGIYSSPGEWSNIFGSYGVVLDNSYPLWFATYNDDESLSMGTPFGGWSSAVGHQYTDQSASGQFDLNVFA